jgi:hypothetical protein
MKEQTSQHLYAYWNEVRGDRIAPRRFEIEPSRIAPILPDTFILERQGRRDYCFRLAGTRLCDHLGREFRGINLLDLWSGEDQEIIIRLLESVTQEGAVGVVVFEARGARDRAATFELLLLPLIHTGSEITRLLGSITAQESADWLGSERLDRWTIRSFDLVWPDGRPHAVLMRMDRQAPFAREPRYSRIVRQDRRAFRVYDGGRSGDDGAK